MPAALAGCCAIAPHAPPPGGSASRVGKTTRSKRTSFTCLADGIWRQRGLEKQRRCHKLIAVPFRIIPRALPLSGLFSFDFLATAEAAQ